MITWSIVNHVSHSFFRQPFPSGEKVTWTGKECLCTKCIQIPTVSTPNNDGLVPSIIIYLFIDLQFSSHLLSSIHS